MSPDELVAVFDTKIVGLELSNNLPKDFLRALPHQLETVLDTPTLAIGGWEDFSEGPLVLGVDTSGQMVSVVAVNPAQVDLLNDALVSIDEWLSTMTLRSLSELSGNSVEFYEGLLELSPRSSVVLSPRRRFVLLTAMGELDTANIAARLPEADFDVQYLDVLQAPDGRAVIRGRDTHVANAARTAAATPLIDIGEDAAVEEFSVAPKPDAVIDLTGQDDEVDLRSNIHPPTLAPDLLLPEIEAGGTYSLEHLPLLFDATGTTLESISDELFAVNNVIVIVANLPERRRDTPFEDRSRFRWDTSLDRIQLLNEHGFTAAGDRRTVHLFVESDRQPEYAVYVGELSRTAFQTQTRVDGETAWFSIAPNLQPDLYRSLRKGRLPQFEGRTVDITTRQL